MDFKKYILAGGLSTVLLLGACGGTEEESAEEETTEESSGEADATEEETEVVEQDTEDNVEAEEEAEEDLSEEEAEAAEEVEETETTEDAPDGVETIKEVEPGETTQIENVNVTVNKAQINQLEVNEDLAIFLDGYEVGDTLENLVIEYTVENTTDAARDFYIDQAVVVTSTGQQIEPEMLLAENITASMLGAVEYTGSVPYLMEEGAGEDIEWVDINIPAMTDGESYERVADETQIRIEF